MKAWAVGITCALVASASFVLNYFSNRADKTGFFYNQEVFSRFEGKAYLEKKLDGLRMANKKILDSLTLLVQSGRSDLTDRFDERAQAFSIQEKQLSDQYTAEIWKFINDSVKEYGSANGYDYIFGATGDGSLMYAKEGKDLSGEIIEFANARYQGNPMK
jgi:outer membrane protein